MVLYRSSRSVIVLGFSATVEPGAVTPVSLLQETGHRVTPEGFLDALAPAYAAWEGQFQTHGFAPLRKQWLAHAAFVARHQLKDLSLAVRYAESLRLHAKSPRVPAWARQMEIFMRVDMNEYETAKLLLGALLASGEVTDPSEFRFLAGRLAELQAAAATAPQNRSYLKN